MSEAKGSRKPRDEGNLAGALAALGARPITDLEAMVREARGESGSLSPADRLLILDQALVLLEGLYAHLPMKRVRHAINPLQALRLLRERAGALSEQGFHSEMLRIFRSLHDIHTAYTPPPPYERLSAFLPFLMECYGDAEGRSRHLVTRVIAGYEHPTFREGVEIVSWHGAPMAKAVARHAAEEVGANADARRALGNLFMTVRWLGACLVPQEEWVILGYRTGIEGEDEELREIRLPWSLLDLGTADVQFAIQSVWMVEEKSSAHHLDRALDLRCLTEQQTRRHLFARSGGQPSGTLGVATASGEESARPDLRSDTIESRLPLLFSAQKLTTSEPEDSYGYLRLRAFEHSNVNEFVAEFRRLLAAMPRSGLLLDLRGNPGGVVRCAESLLQLLTPKRIRPLPFRFRATPLALKLTSSTLGKLAKFPQWRESIEIAQSTGHPLSAGYPLTSEEEANAIGQEYFGPVVLIVDAVTYSAGDIFSAGFVDHGIGPVLGVDGTTVQGETSLSDLLDLMELPGERERITTGGGGANVTDHTMVAMYLPDAPELQPLPGGCHLRIAFRSCERTGAAAGLPIEELGVPAAHRHTLSQRDILEDNPDLKAAAIALVAREPRCWLELEVNEPEGMLLIRQSGLDGLDIYLDERPLTSLNASESSSLQVKLPKKRSFRTLEVRGFAAAREVARRRWSKSD